PRKALPRGNEAGKLRRHAPCPGHIRKLRLTVDPEDDEPADETLSPEGGRTLQVELTEADAGMRLDKALAEAAPALSRARLQALLEAGAVSCGGQPVGSGSARARPGLYRIAVPAPVPDTP